MSIRRLSLLVLAASVASASAARAQVPAELRAAMAARDSAFYAADPVRWGAYTASNYTTVQQDGSFQTRAERLVTLRQQKPRPYAGRTRELNDVRGDVAIARFRGGAGLWVLEVWTRESGRWVVLMSQVTAPRQ